MSASLYNEFQPIAFTGMKVDSMEDNVDTNPCGPADIPFGRVCIFIGGNPPAQTHTVTVGIAGVAAGISLHDHLIGAYGNGYRQFDAVSVLTRGRVWAEVSTIAESAGIAYGAPVAYELATGMVTAGANPLLINATYRSGIVTVPPIWPSLTLGAGRIALVELHYPMR